ncbi:Serine carboxypeptidase-like 40 [Striga hermonthica]|uniref:Carboxypeptidase n=1 Tax=Striga hermonthica TaxID=68872 RepID=A0A9N7MSN7_STRHE|nr:Serine carboxypeptidase-like 40 [Striga hermonthica]
MIPFACLTSNSNALKSQSEALFHLYKHKFKTNTHIDRRPFSPIADFPKERILSQEGSKRNDLIEHLPRQPQVPFQQYGGYVTVDVAAGRSLFYYFVEADPKISCKLPLVLWLNGGPGCSSLGYGAMEELGPFRVSSDGKTLYENEYSWNHAANMLFLETPAGVGFSYSKTKSDVEKGGDKETAIDNYVFLLNWLERFPEYKNRDFYLAGESYAGHYVPQLAQTILYHNKAKNTVINMKGIITDKLGMFEYWQTHALISNETLNQILKYCDFSPNATTSDKCNKILDRVYHIINEIDVYNIYAPLCLNPNLTTRRREASVLNFDPCSDNYVYAYLNRPEVQKALHANVTKSIPYDWKPCSDVLKKWTNSAYTILPILHELMTNGIRVSIFR